MDSFARLQDAIARCLSRYENLVAERTVLAAVSGGVDSTALLLALARLRSEGRLPGPLQCCHVDHGVRTDSSENAAQLRAFADRNGFGWKFALASREMLSALQQAYGPQFLTPTAEPMLFVSPTQRPSAGSYGRRDAGTMRALVAANRG